MKYYYNDELKKTFETHVYSRSVWISVPQGTDFVTPFRDGIWNTFGALCQELRIRTVRFPDTKRTTYKCDLKFLGDTFISHGRAINLGIGHVQRRVLQLLPGAKIIGAPKGFEASVHGETQPEWN